MPIPDRALSRTRRGSVVALGVLMAIGFAGCARPTAEDSRRVELMKSDPLMAVQISGAGLTSVTGYPGHGGGPATTWSEASRRGAVSGEAASVMREVVMNAMAAGWAVTAVNCWNDGGFSASGAKALDGFVAHLSVSIFMTKGVVRLLIRLSTPPVEGHAQQETVSPNMKRLTTLEGTCLAGP